ncbi:glycosyltransferase [Pseudodesulfovibrio sp.]|uniref:glycosyltransferase n=1 Tax=Pseudodesulfovibrio sp. TaxID=2035812 RepID=UPI00261583A3|nr:glycosyltransferase [Pseudodesulfovibrio sp.]MDD3310582.1 glycosyltransferase [Pseudodesulfovibrio sp.]
MPESLPASFVRPRPLRAALLSLPVTVLYLSLAWALVAALPDRAWAIRTQALVTIGLFGLWRYSWQLLHVVRHWRYRRHEFPRLRAEAMALARKYPERLYVMVPSYREEFHVSQLVFEALVREARTVPSKVMIYASVGSDEEIAFISKVINATPGGSEVDVVFMRQGEGKRVAMGYALRAIARDFNDPLSWHPDAKNDLVIFMDGDTLVEPGLFRKCLPYFRSNPRLGALTPDNLGVSPNAVGAFSDWYTLKFAQRNHIFHSHSLSHRVLTITGRFSIYRAGAVVTEEFIRFLEADHLDHWLFGRFRFLMGDDKSTWYYMLKEGWEMLYVPDATAVALEVRRNRFFRTSLSLMHRWYGNMLRNNWRAVKLGPRPMGGFIWWCIVDQRLSSFTPLIGPLSALLLSAFDSWFYLVFYLAWVILTRLAMMWVYVLEGMRLRVLHVPLTLYNQWVGAVLKIYSMHSLDIQTWSKEGGEAGPDEPGPGAQRIGGDGNGGGQPGYGLLRGAVRFLLLALNTSLLIMVCGVFSGAFSLPGLAELSYYRTRLQEGRLLSRRVVPQPGPSALVRRIDVAPLGSAVNAALEAADPGEALRIVLPAGTVRLDEPIRIGRSGVTLAGAGPGVTVLVSDLRAPAGAAVLVGGGKGEVVGPLNGAANAGDTVLSVDHWPPDARYLWVGAPNDDAFLDSIGDRHWRGKTPWVRQFLAEVAGSGRGYVLLRQGLPVAMPAGAEVRAPEVVRGVTLSGFTVVQRAGDLARERAAGVYGNLAPDFAVDGVRLDWAAGCALRDVAVIDAGRHPLVFENSRDIRAVGLRIDGAWNKGEGGNGYVRFARCFDCELTDSEVRNVRHLAFQWGASGNRVEGCRIGADVNFHGGLSSGNVVRDSVVVPPPGHPWPAVTRMPEGGAAWAPPDGPGNVVEGAEPEAPPRTE